MGGLFERMEAILSASGALLELQELIEFCCEQTLPEDVWQDDENDETCIDETNAWRYLESFDHEELLTKLHKAHHLIAEAELKLIAYRLEAQL